MSKRSRMATMVFCCVFALIVSLAGIASAEDIPLVDGNEWTQSSMAEKKSYVIGVSNMLVIEYLYQKGSQQIPNDKQTTVQRFFKGTEDMSIYEAIAIVDDWYSKNPGKLDEPALIVFWNTVFESKM